MSAIALDKVIPFLTVANPAVTNAVPESAVELGVNAMLDTMPTTASLAIIFKIDLLTPVVSSIESVENTVCPDPATVVGPISVQAVPL